MIATLNNSRTGKQCAIELAESHGVPSLAMHRVRLAMPILGIDPPHDRIETDTTFDVTDDTGTHVGTFFKKGYSPIPKPATCGCHMTDVGWWMGNCKVHAS